MIIVLRSQVAAAFEDAILSTTPLAAAALNIVNGKNEHDIFLRQFLKLAALCEELPSQNQEWRSSDGKVFILSNIGMPSAGKPSVLLIRLTLKRNTQPGTTVLWQTALDCGLTAREASVFEHLAGGTSDKKIGEAMRLSSHTIRSHIRKIYRKLGVAGKVEAVSKILAASPR